MGIRTLLFVAIFLFCCGGALFVPLFGLLGYTAHYIIGPEGQWWAAPLRPLDIHYSLTLAVVSAVGIACNLGKLRYGSALLSFHEKMFLLFIALLWVLREISEPTIAYTVVDHPALKITKVAIFCLMLTHVVTDVKNVRFLLWTLVVSTFLLGLEAYAAPRSAFAYGRLETIGGVDFREANFLPAFIVGVLPLMGVLFLDSRWLGKLVALAAGVFSVNAVVLARSRGAVVGIALGVIAAALLAPKQYRLKIFAGLLAAALGGLYLSDPGFLARVDTLSRDADERDRSAESRVELWHVGLSMLQDQPLGIGPGNFSQVAGKYDIRYQNRDAHNTYVRCFAELGIEGFLLFIGLIVHSIVVLKRTMRKAWSLPPEHRNQILLPSYGVAVGLFMMLGCGLTVTLLYMEALWWFLMIPVCLERAADNLIADLENAPCPVPEEMKTDAPD